MSRWTPVLSLLACVALAGCASSAVVHPASPGPAAGSADAARDRATKQAQRLLGHAVIPPGAVTLADAPASLPGPALGVPGESTYVDLKRFYRVPMSFAETLAYVKAHPPAGLTAAGSSGGTGYLSAGVAWDGVDYDNPATSGQLSVVMSPDGPGSSYFRVDAGHYWSDPRPAPDTAAGPRLRIESGGRCPTSDARAVGVRNSGAGLSQALAPDATATGGLVCSYAGLNSHPDFALLHSRTLTASEAARLGSLAHRVDLSHSDGGLRHCPMDDGSAVVLVLDYPGRPAVDLWLHERGCGFVSNGQVTAAGGTLSDAVQAFQH